MSKPTQVIAFVAVAAIALAAGFLLHPGSRQKASTPPAAASELLRASLPDLSGQPQPLARWQGKVVLVNFWATWCAPCRKEIPALIRAQEQLGPKGLQIVGIAIDQLDKVRPYAAEMGINYPILIGELDAMELARQAGNEMGALPFTVILDRSGTAVRAELGQLNDEKLAELLQPLL